MAVKHAFQLYIQSQNADPAPPLGTILGNVGVNTVKFCQDFNAATATLPPFYTVCVLVEVSASRTYTFQILPPTINSFVGLLAKTIPTPKGEKGVYRSIRVRDAIILAR